MSWLDTFRTASPNRQMLAVGAICVLIAAVLIGVYALALRKPYGVLFSDLRASYAATIAAELDKRKIPYRLEDSGATILVPRDAIDATRLAIAGEDLPIKGTVGFELFNKSDMGLTEFAQRINYQRALQGELARTLMSMDAVEWARMHLMLAEPTVFRDDRQPSKAAATLQARPGRTISPAMAQGIQRLIAAAVPDLTADDVVVLDADGRSLTAAQAGAPQEAFKGSAAANWQAQDAPRARPVFRAQSAATLSPTTWAILIVVMLGLLVIAAGLALWRLGAPRRLSERRRRDLAARLEQALQREDRHVAPSF
jgi:flagellar M-ring protein FliF